MPAPSPNPSLDPSLGLPLDPAAATDPAGQSALLAAAEFRQLRHQTKNSLQRILLLIEEHAAQWESEAGRAMAADLQHRISLTAALSDALFGFTQTPDAFAWRLGSLCESLVALLRGADQKIRLACVAAGRCPPALEGTVLRVAHELVGNAVKHGMYARAAGRIDVHLEVDRREVRLLVTDDGWGWIGQPSIGEGLSLARLIAAEAGGTVSLTRHGDHSVALLVLSRAAGEDTDCAAA